MRKNKEEDKKNNNKMMFLKKIFRTRDFYIWMLVVATSLVLTWRIFAANQISGFGWAAMIEVILETIFFGGIYLFDERELPIERKFLFAVIFLGTMFILALPPGQAPDDRAHFQRAYGVASGYFQAEVRDSGAGSEMPVGLTEPLKGHPEHGTYERVWGQLGEGVSEETSFQTYNNSAVYSFVGYIPQALAALVGKVFGLSTMWMGYLMKVFNFMVFVILTYYAIKIIPKFKSVILFIALLPITLQEATAIGLDAITIGLSFFLVAYVLYLAYAKKKAMDRREIALLYAIAAVIGFCKIIYLPLLLLFIIIPAERFGSKKRKWVHLTIMAGVTLCLNVLWMAISLGVPFAMMNPGVDIDPVRQLKYIILHPFGYIATILNTVEVNAQFWISSSLGMSLGYFAFNLPSILLFTTLGMEILVLLQRNETLKMKIFDRAVFAVVFLVIIALMLATLYMQWTAVGANVIEGIQGRYFLPILLLVPIIICRRRTGQKTYATLVSDKTIMYYGLFVNVIACAVIVAQNI